MPEVTLTERQADVTSTEQALNESAAHWLEHRAAGHVTSTIDARLDNALRAHRAAVNRHTKTLRRLAKQED